MTIDQAIIMAAGYAKRMRPLTDDMPKPLLEVGGKPLLTHIIDHLIAENVKRIIINGHHAIQHLKNYIEWAHIHYPSCEFILSEEDSILETGGGLINALPHLNKNAPFYMINGDAYWLNHSSQRSLQSLLEQWKKTDSNLLLLLQPCETMNMTKPVGDYDLLNDVATRSHNKSGQYMFTGIRVCHPKILKEYPIESFSFLEIMDKQDSQNKLEAVDHKGRWYHISTPDDLNEVNAAIERITQ